VTACRASGCAVRYRWSSSSVMHSSRGDGLHNDQQASNKDCWKLPSGT
jgi:hypothetical protein